MRTLFNALNELIHTFDIIDTIKERRILMKSMTPFLMFEGRAEEAILFYRSVFKDFEVVFINYF